MRKAFLMLACAGCAVLLEAAEAFCTVSAMVASPLLLQSLPCSGLKIPPSRTRLVRRPSPLILHGAAWIQPPASEDLSKSRVSPSNLIAFPGGGLFFWWQAGYVQSLQEQNPAMLEVRCFVLSIEQLPNFSLPCVVWQIRALPHQQRCLSGVSAGALTAGWCELVGGKVPLRVALKWDEPHPIVARAMLREEVCR